MALNGLTVQRPTDWTAPARIMACAVLAAARFSSRCASVQRPAPKAIAGSHINTNDSLCRALRCAVIRGRTKWLKTDYESAALPIELLPDRSPGSSVALRRK